MGLKSWWLNSNHESAVSEWVSVGDVDEEGPKIQIFGCRRSPLKTLFVWLFTLLTFGILRLIFYWKPQWEALFTCSSCSLNVADIILIRNLDHQWFLRRVRIVNLSADGHPPAAALLGPNGECLRLATYKYFTHRKVVYVWHPSFNAFHSLPMFDYNIRCPVFHQISKGLTSTDVECRTLVYGANEIVVRLKPIVHLLFLETLNPFYIFQVFSVCVWFTDEYYYYASVIVIMSLISIVVDVYQTRKNQRALRDTIYTTDDVEVLRDDQPETIRSTQLVPGDVILLPQRGGVMQCDAVLLAGNVIVNESMLTGESVPVTKTPVPSANTDADHGSLIYENKKHAKHTLYCGTRVLQTRYYSGQSVKAVVIRTGFSTLKGQLVRSIMYPKPIDFEFTKDLLRFVGVLAGVATIGFIYTIILMAIRGNSLSKIIIRALDIITIVVPPALPAAMTIGIVAAEQRLKKAKVYCISPSTINTCGGINAVCFDKTGTLTEEGLDLFGVLPAAPDLSLDKEIHQVQDLNFGDELLRSMACCHSLTQIDGELTGDPLDLILFRQTNWRLEEPDVVEESGRFDLLAPTVVRPPDGTFEIGILRQFTFSSNLQRMSTITRVLGSSDLVLYCKGAPEVVAGLCIPESVPADFSAVLQMYAKRGYRVLAAGRRRLTKTGFVKFQRAPRTELETDLEFLGLVVLENRLKPESTPVIGQLRRALIRTIMVTGDNILTAVSVSRDSGILDDHRPLYFVETDIKGEMASIRARPEEQASSSIGRLNYVCDTAGLLDDNCWDVEVGQPNGFVANGLLKNKYSAKVDYQMAITGPSFATLVKNFPHLVPSLVAVCNVYARMAPEQKAQLITSLQDIGYIVAMCGDGANDCGALKAAHAGISLSEAEASIASPFTSKTPNISCVPTVIREGRAALTTSFGVFKYMAGYSLTQFLSVSLLYWIGTNLSDFQFLYIDLFLITVFAVLFGYTPAADTLVAQPPATRILSVVTISSIGVQLLIVAAFQIFAFEFISTQPWFVPLTMPGDEDNFDTYQGSIVFLQSLFQYITLVIVYSKSYPYRKTLFNNRPMLVALVICTTGTILVTLCPPEPIVHWLEVKMPPYLKYRLFVVFVAVINFFISSIAERFLVDWFLDSLAVRRGWLPWQQQQTAKYDDLLNNIGRNPTWCRDRRKRLISAAASSVGQPHADSDMLDVRKLSVRVSTGSMVTAVESAPGSDDEDYLVAPEDAEEVFQDETVKSPAFETKF